jgi:phosphopantothenoylcysteine decarboxylase/phosphopantothenate--cysteine ligase
MDHLAIAERSSALVVAPATAHAIARLALGLADDALGTIALACGGPLIVAPAMEPAMWRNPATQAHAATLRSRGARFVGPTEGRLASGRSGLGRMAEPDEIVAEVVAALAPSDLTGRTVVVTAGPTREPIDPVRFVSNRSSGRLGYAVAQLAAARGADVILISGPVALDPPRGARVLWVERAEEMHRLVLEHAPGADVLVMAAAVADYRPQTVFPSKIKKSSEKMSLDLERNPDILSDLADLVGGRSRRPVVAGFAAETERPWEAGAAKRAAKELDLLMAPQDRSRDNPLGRDREPACTVVKPEIAMPD